MGVVWWATHKLTFDCTLLDEDQDAGVGLLQESGLEPVNPDETVPTPRDAKAPSDPDEMDASLLPQRPWWKLWEVDSGEARRPHAPGVTLVYFTLASLPIFGLGQWFVPAVDEDRRSGLFLYFLAYIASGMGLLLATSFLNLRRYLRQRKVKMPGAMTATWLSTGAILIVGLTADGGGPAPAHRGLEGDGAGPRRVKATSGHRNMRSSRIVAFRARGHRAKDRRRRSPGARPVLGQGQGLGEDERSQRVTADQRPGETGGQFRPGAFQVRRSSRQARSLPRRSARQKGSLAGPVRRSGQEGRSVGRTGQGRSSQGPGRPIQGPGRAGRMPRRTPSKVRRKVRNKATRSHRRRIRLRAMEEARRSNSHRSRSRASRG